MPGPSKWTVDETKCLIELYGENFSSLEKLSRKKPIYERISKKLKDAGFDRSSAQVQKKIANLRSEYTKNQPGPTGSEPPAWIHYAALHKILHERPALNSTVAQTSEIGLNDDDPHEVINDEEEEIEDSEESPDSPGPQENNRNTPPPGKRQRLSSDIAKTCSDTLSFMKEQAAIRQQEREENQRANSQILGILDRIASAAETMANTTPAFHFVHE